MPNPVVTNHAWLRMLATELESKHFPPGYGPQLRHTAEILETSQIEVAKLDQLNLKLGVDLANKDHEFAKLRHDMAILWSRYKDATEIVSRYEPDTAVKMAEYKPKSYEAP